MRFVRPAMTADRTAAEWRCMDDAGFCKRSRAQRSWPVRARAVIPLHPSEHQGEAQA
jgi:hypothetical protein